MWPLQPPSGSTCTRCGGPRVFELQLMAPLISLLIEAGEVLSQGNLDAVDFEAVNAAANWDMCTLAVFTCARACRGVEQSQLRGQELVCSYDEEQVLLVNEEDCHVAV